MRYNFRGERGELRIRTSFMPAVAHDGSNVCVAAFGLHVGDELVDCLAVIVDKVELLAQCFATAVVDRLHGRVKHEDYWLGVHGCWAFVAIAGNDHKCFDSSISQTEITQRKVLRTEHSTTINRPKTPRGHI